MTFNSEAQAIAFMSAKRKYEGATTMGEASLGMALMRDIARKAHKRGKQSATQSFDDELFRI